MPIGVTIFIVLVLLLLVRFFLRLWKGGSDVAHDTIDMVVEAVVDLAVHLFGSYLETLIFRRHRGCCCTNAPGLPNVAESPNARHPSDPEDRREEGGHVPANAPNAHVPANTPNAPEDQPEEGGAVPPNAPNAHDLEDPEDDLQQPEEGCSEPEDDLQQPEEGGSEPEDADDIV